MSCPQPRDRPCHRDSPAPYLGGRASVPWVGDTGMFLLEYWWPFPGASFLAGLWCTVSEFWQHSWHVGDALPRWAMLLSPKAAGWHILLDLESWNIKSQYHRQSFCHGPVPHADDTHFLFHLFSAAEDVQAHQQGVPVPGPCPQMAILHMALMRAEALLG